MIAAVHAYVRVEANGGGVLTDGAHVDHTAGGHSAMIGIDRPNARVRGGQRNEETRPTALCGCDAHFGAVWLKDLYVRAEAGREDVDVESGRPGSNLEILDSVLAAAMEGLYDTATGVEGRQLDRPKGG